MLLLAVLFLCKFKMPKPNLCGIMIQVGIGAAEFITIVLILLLSRL